MEDCPVHTLALMISLLFVLFVILKASHGTKHIRGDYEVIEIYNALSDKDCRDIIQYSRLKGMSNSDVLSYGTPTDTVVNESFRSSKTRWVDDKEHHVARKLAALSWKLSGIPPSHQEALQVAHYKSSRKFDAHFDACVYDDKAYCDKMNNNSGQRFSTLLVYLNDNFTGGETEFVNINNVKIKPEKGKAIFFWNTDENEKILQESQHRGNPVGKGEKWICTKWSHPRAYSKRQ